MTAASGATLPRRQGLAARCGLGLAGLAALLALWWLGTDVLAPAGGMARRFAPGPRSSAWANS